jgi:hypothetical protein
MFVQQNAN